METRPIIKLTLSPLDNKLELINKIFLLGMWAMTIYIFLKSPTASTTHFNNSGQADEYEKKLKILILPTFATVIYYALTELIKYPHSFNYITKINEGNAKKQYTIATRMLRFLKFSILVIFSLIILFTYLTKIGVANGLGLWFLPLTFSFILTPPIICLYQSLKKNNRVA